MLAVEIPTAEPSSDRLGRHAENACGLGHRHPLWFVSLHEVRNGHAGGAVALSDVPAGAPRGVLAEDAPAALFGEHGIDEARDIWLWKPAVSPAAAAMVRDWICGRQGAAALPGEGRQVFLFRRGPEVGTPADGSSRSPVRPAV